MNNAVIRAASWACSSETSAPTLPSGLATVSPREEEVVRLVARGRSTREISAELFVSGHTVQRHIQNAFEKAGVRSRGELVKRLFFENLLPGVFGD